VDPSHPREVVEAAFVRFGIRSDKASAHGVRRCSSWVGFIQEPLTCVTTSAHDPGRAQVCACFAAPLSAMAREFFADIEAALARDPRAPVYNRRRPRQFSR
jgi:hypothetical protein